MNAKPIKRKLDKRELRLVTVDTENNAQGQPTRFHVSRFQYGKRELTGTACGHKNFTGSMWSFYDWIFKNDHVMCEQCRRAIEYGDGLYG